jgi:hypothetical protein
VHAVGADRAGDIEPIVHVERRARIRGDRPQRLGPLPQRATAQVSSPELHCQGAARHRRRHRRHGREQPRPVEQREVGDRHQPQRGERAHYSISPITGDDALA